MKNKELIEPNIAEKPRRGRPKGSKNKPKKKKKRAKKNPSNGSAKGSCKSNKAIEGWGRFIVGIGDKIEESKPLVSYKDKLLVSAGGIAIVTGKPKSCKTFLASAIIGAFFSGEYMGIISHSNNDKAKVLLCDTSGIKGKCR